MSVCRAPLSSTSQVPSEIDWCRSKIQLMVRGTADETLAKQNIPLIEGTLLRVFSAASAEQLMTFEGKEKLRKDSLEECRRVLKDLVSSPVIEQVLFTGFVMQ